MNSMNFDNNQAPNITHASQVASNKHPENETHCDKIESNRVHPTSVSEISINPADVLCGRGKISFNHVGNRRFRDVISAAVTQYNEAESRLEKAKIVNRIVEEIRASGGRFLRQDEKAGTWHALNHAQCREKVGHAVRDATSSIEGRKKRKLVQEEGHKSVGGAIFAKPTNGATTTLDVAGLPLIAPSMNMDDTNAGNNMFVGYQKQNQPFSSFAAEETPRLDLSGSGSTLSDIFGAPFQLQPQRQLPLEINQLQDPIKSNMWSHPSASSDSVPRKMKPFKELEDDDDQFLAFIDDVLGPPPASMSS